MVDSTLQFKEQITSLLKAKEFHQVSLLIKDKRNEEHVKETAWDLLPHILQWCRDNEEHYSHCSDILQHFSKVGNPKEMLIAFLEQTDFIKDDTYFKALLTPLQTLLQNLPGKRGKSLEWTFNTLYNHIIRLPLPEQHNFEGEERKLMDLDSNVQRINDVLMAYLSFIEPFVQEVSHEYCKNHEVHYMDRIIHQRKVLCKHLLQILGHPLAYLDLSHTDTKAKSTSRICCEKVMMFLCKMQGNLFMLYDLLPEDESRLDKYHHGHTENFEEKYTRERPHSYTSDSSIETLSNATLAYTIFAEELAVNNIPSIYTHAFVFEKHLKYIIALLTKKEDCVLYKGLHLAKKLLSLLANKQFSAEYLDIREFTVLSNVLFPIMIYSSVQEYRLLSLSLFNQFFLKFELKGRYNILCFLLECQKHIGVRGLLIHNYRNQLHEALLKQASYNPFIGNGLKKFLKAAVKIPGVETVDLLEHCEEILEIINFIRYLVIRDSVALNETGIWTYIRDLEDCYLKPLRKAIDLSRAHYKLRLSELTENRKARKQIDIALSVKGKTLPDVPPEQHVETLNSALITFDLIESVLVTLQENIDNSHVPHDA